MRRMMIVADFVIYSVHQEQHFLSIRLQTILIQKNMKLIVAQRVNEIAVLFGTVMFITVYKRARYWTGRIQSTLSCPTYTAHFDIFGTNPEYTRFQCLVYALLSNAECSCVAGCTNA
jgi:hypothetical protein